MLDDLRFYLHSKSSSVWRYALSETLQALLGWAPGLPGIAARAVAYKAILHAEGFSAIEDHVRIVRAEDVWLGERVYLDHGVYLHGGPGGLHIGAGSWIMHGSSLHVFNFREMPQSGIRLGRRTFVGEGTMMRGQGGIRVGDNVLFGPGAQLLAVNHVCTDSDRPVMDQGITAEGIVIEDKSLRRKPAEIGCVLREVPCDFLRVAVNPDVGRPEEVAASDKCGVRRTLACGEISHVWVVTNLVC